MRRYRLMVLAAAVLVVLVLAGCGGPNNVSHVNAPEIAGFWRGLWDGFTAMFAFFAQLFGSKKYNIYEVHNNGLAYNFGFMLGIGAFADSASSTVKRRRDS